MDRIDDTDPARPPPPPPSIEVPGIPRALVVAWTSAEGAFVARSLSAMGLQVFVFTDLDDAVDFVSGDRGGPSFFLVHQVGETHDLVRAEGLAAAQPTREVIRVPFYVLEEHREDPARLHALVRRGAVSTHRAVDRIGTLLHSRRTRGRLELLRTALNRA